MGPCNSYMKFLHLAVPVDAYEQLFLGPMARRILSQYQVRMLVFDPIREDITEWAG